MPDWKLTSYLQTQTSQVMKPAEPVERRQQRAPYWTMSGLVVKVNGRSSRVEMA